MRDTTLQPKYGLRWRREILQLAEVVIHIVLLEFVTKIIQITQIEKGAILIA